MQIYLVGGAVRDALLGRVVKERDYVVVGSCEQEMLAHGFLPVGKSFPVFLHPKTKEEYALARREKKIAKGYGGFDFETGASVTLEQDLSRRDLTINAIAQDSEGNLIDPYEGQKDLKERVLRHVSDAFVEDPVRILRVARFAARYASLGFRVAKETNALMYQMVKNGEAAALVPERVWAETEKALMEEQPHIFFQTLRQCGALACIFPEINALFGVPATKYFHREIDTGVHTLMVLAKAAMLGADAKTRFAALTHDLGKALSPWEALPSHPNHGENGISPLMTLCERLKVPTRHRELAKLVAKYHTDIHKSMKMQAKQLHALLMQLDVIRKPERFKGILKACQADAYGRIRTKRIAYPQIGYLTKAVELLQQIDIQAIIKTGLTGEQIRFQLQQQQINTLEKYIREYQ